MKVVIRCPRCAQRVRVPDERGEIQVLCPSCDLKWSWAPGVTPSPEASDESSGGVGRLWKKVKNAVTGGSADVLIRAPKTLILGEPFSVEVGVHVGDMPIESKGIYVQLHATESIDLPWRKILRSDEFRRRPDTPLILRRDDLEYNEVIEKHRWTLAAGSFLPAGAHFEFEREIDLSPGVPTSYRGKNARLDWALNAYVHLSFAKPKSEWHAVHVQY